jgi:hypothetical protein
MYSVGSQDHGVSSDDAIMGGRRYGMLGRQLGSE